MKPVIGVSCYVEQARWGPWDVPTALVPLSYVQSLEEVGGRPVVVPPSDQGIDETLAILDGIVFTGGSDIDPELYGAASHPETLELRPDRDRSEAALMSGALDLGMPMLAICRGMQLLNVVRGGDLDQHLPELVGHDEHRERPGVFAPHGIEIDPNTRLGAFLGEHPPVPSHHHQAPRNLGRGLRVAARAPDGTIEAVEDPDARMVVGVLWHPEQGEDRALFEALVEAAAVYKKERA